MAGLSPDQYLKKPLYSKREMGMRLQSRGSGLTELIVYDLPPEILETLRPYRGVSQGPDQEPERRQSSRQAPQSGDDSSNSSGDHILGVATCGLCGVNFQHVDEQRAHVKSDFHAYNLKQQMRGKNTATETEFEQLIDDINDSLSGSDSSSSSEDEAGDSLLSRFDEATSLSSSTGFNPSKKRKRGVGGSPLIWFKTPLIPAKYSLGAYRATMNDEEQLSDNPVAVLRSKQLPLHQQVRPATLAAQPESIPPHVFLCMLGGDHFAAMVISLAPKMGRKAQSSVDERQAEVLAHKTFHRYVTRRKQGGAQSSNDNAKGAAHSAGAALRRYNEDALKNDVRALLKSWKPLIDSSDLLFVRTSRTGGRQTLFGEDSVMSSKDARLRSFPFSTRRPTQAELIRAFVELTRLKVRDDDQVSAKLDGSKSGRPKDPAASKPQQSMKEPAPKLVLSPAEQIAHDHTRELLNFVRRSKVPALLAYLNKHSISPDFPFHPSAFPSVYHTPTPLHLASSSNIAPIISALLTRAGADPTILNGEGKPAYSLAGDRTTRDAFRIARFELGEDRWGWDAAGVPAGISKADAAKAIKAIHEEEEAVKRKEREAEVEKVRLEEESREQAKKDLKEAKKNVRMVRKHGVGSSLLGGGGPSQDTGIGVNLFDAAKRRDEETEGLRPEAKMRLERERRARAAEERMNRSAGSGAKSGAGR